MISGHGDDLHKYKDIRANFSSNVYADTDNHQLLSHLSSVLVGCLGSYPEPEPYGLQRLLAEALGVSADEVLVTNGATEAIYLVAQLYQRRRSCIIEPTFSEYRDACQLYHHILLDASLEQEAEVVWMCSPNNPTGSPEAEELRLERIKHSEQAFVIDRSYEYFCRSELPQRVCLPDRLYIYSLTKRYKIPGLRLGYIVGEASTIDRLRQLRQPWSVNALAIEAGKWIVRNDFPDTIARAALWHEADRLSRELAALPYGWEVTRGSQTHFFLVRTPYIASELKEYLAVEHGLLIRDASNFHGLSPHHIRIATQTPQMNDWLLEALRAYCATHTL